jgi:peptide/nickel transport system permease protein
MTAITARLPARPRNALTTAGVVAFLIVLGVALVGRVITPFDPNSVGVGAVTRAPNATHWMGTDQLGRDVFSRVVVGAGISLLVGFSAAGFAALVGVFVGAVAGYAGGWIDDVLMRITEVFQVIPRFFLALVLVALFGGTIINIIIAIAALSWPIIARVTRSEFLTLRSRQFVDAARLAGANPVQLVFREILPNAIPVVIVGTTIQIGDTIALEAGLAYLGLGDPNQVSLGLLLAQAQSIMRIAWWAAFFPGLILFIAVLGANLLGDALNERWSMDVRSS